jgi:DNA (cytosine-5)-methyltransferase 1
LVSKRPIWLGEAAASEAAFPLSWVKLVEIMARHAAETAEGQARLSSLHYLWHTDRGGGKPLFGWRTRYWSFLLKLSKRLPSWTVQAQPGASIGPFHWNNRKLSSQELCRIQTFPDGLLLESGRTEMQRMLGNAVPSLIAEVLAREVRRQFFNTPVKTPLKLLPPKREEVPPPVKVAKLPKKYHLHIGHHEAHPGEGKGRLAVKLRAELETAE